MGSYGHGAQWDDRSPAIATTGSDTSLVWDRVRARLQGDVGDVEYRTWLRQMSFAGIDGDEVTLTLPTRFLRDWVHSHYADRLGTLWRAELPGVRRIDVRVAAAPDPGSDQTAAP